MNKDRHKTRITIICKAYWITIMNANIWDTFIRNLKTLVIKQIKKIECTKGMKISIVEANISFNSDSIKIIAINE